MPTILDLKTEVLHRIVFELRYEFGQIYWDRAGRVARSVLAEFEGWDFDTVDNNRCQISEREKNLIFSFGHDKLDVSQTQSTEVAALISIGELGKIAEALTKLVVTTLELEFFPRVGFRTWYLYPTKTREDSNKLLENLKLLRLDPSAKSSIGKVSELSHRLVVDRGKHMVRAAVASFEQQVNLDPSLVRSLKAKSRGARTAQNKVLLDQLKAKKIIQSFPHYGVLLDLDAYMEDPPYPDALSISNFIRDAHEDFGALKLLVLESAT